MNNIKHFQGVRNQSSLASEATAHNEIDGGLEKRAQLEALIEKQGPYTPEKLDEELEKRLALARLVEEQGKYTIQELDNELEKRAALNRPTRNRGCSWRGTQRRFAHATLNECHIAADQSLTHRHKARCYGRSEGIPDALGAT